MELRKPSSLDKIAEKTFGSSSSARRAASRRRRAQELLNGLVTKGYVKAVVRGESIFYTFTGKARTMFPATAQKTQKEVILGRKYRLENLRGRGTYGEVWKATDKSLKRPVAVKLLHGGIKDFEQLKAEGVAQGGLTHKNIVVVHDLGSDEKNGWLITEFVDGPSLQEYLADMVEKGEWCPFQKSIRIIERCLEALEFAHEKNRVHGDIKPGNILLPKTGEIKLGDFGVAKILSGSEKKEYAAGYERRLGSSSYAAPEVLKDQPRDFQSDLFSVGILAYVLLTGQHPFMHNSGLIPVAELIKSETYTPKKLSELVEDVPEKYEQIVMRLLEKDKDKRYKTAREVLDEWREKVEMVECPKCNVENTISNKYCGQCGENLRAIREFGSGPERDLKTSFSFFLGGETQRAIDIIKGSLERHGDFAKGWSHLGYMLNSQRQYEEAELACTKSIESDPEYSRGYQTRGFARSNLGIFDEAVEDFTKAYEKETDERRKSMIIYQRGYAKRLAGKLEGALKDAILAISLDETNAKAHKLKESLELSLAPNMSLNVFPSSVYLGVDDVFKVDITISNVPSPGVFSYKLVLHFDPDCLNATDAEIPSGHFLTPTSGVPPGIFIVQPGVINNTAGTVSFAATLLAPEEGKTGSGVLGTVVLMGMASGKSRLSLRNVVLADPNAQSVLQEKFDINDGNVVVEPTRSKLSR
ncbi:MAG: protein kinase [Candidatus Bathyarchaeota archaeon]|nr:protein kinase [Candidatus Bathyarchaeota archaeon]